MVNKGSFVLTNQFILKQLKIFTNKFKDKLKEVNNITIDIKTKLKKALETFSVITTE